MDFSSKPKIIILFSALLFLCLEPRFADASSLHILRCQDAFSDLITAVRETERPNTIAISYPGEKGRVISLELSLPSQAGRPLLLFLPGVNRSGRLSDESSKALIERGFGVAEMDFSVHPFSVEVLPTSERPYYWSRAPKLEDFATEVNLVLSELGKRHGHITVIPVSLSYSGSISPLIQNRPIIIDTVPMTSEKAANPDGAAFRAQLKAGEIFNPIFGPAISRNVIDQAYRTKWSSQADSIIQTFGLSQQRKTDFVEGYTALSRASEDASWSGRAVGNAGRRVFILAEGENQTLLVDQLETFQRLLREKKNVSLVMVEGSGHIIPVEKPHVYASILERMTNGDSQAGGDVIRMRADGSVESFAPGQAAESWLEGVISALKKPRH